ncbi:hypothetical protein CYMTET_13949 [Cymbomonas tetramitiformis]|uniref:Uncharacterized protein n=1 Tax=Cymbomonas tetramitiformis TaxID=36881 RepID=A0AAE0LAD1_9CHLO|nr:hypothetical protein CYMTET_13949 [Cymbomonas tetramitiformis]
MSGKGRNVCRQRKVKEWRRLSLQRRGLGLLTGAVGSEGSGKEGGGVERGAGGGEGLRAAQIGVAVEEGADLGVHTVQAALDQHPEWVCVKVDAKNAFSAVHRETVFEAIERAFPESWAWTGLCYGVEANLGFRLGGVDGSVIDALRQVAGGGVPPEMMRAAEKEHDRRMREALRDLLPGGGLNSHSLEFATLPHGMGLTEATRASIITDSHAGGDGGDGGIEEAREVEQHLPLQTRLPWLYSVTFDSIEPAFLRGIPCLAGGGEVAQQRADEGLALVGRAWEDTFENMDHATQAGRSDVVTERKGLYMGMQQSERASGGASGAGRMAAQLLEDLGDMRGPPTQVDCLRMAGGQEAADTQSAETSMGASGPDQSASVVQDILEEWEDFLSPAPDRARGVVGGEGSGGEGGGTRCDCRRG